MTNKHLPAQVFHPGEHLRDELLARGIGQDAFARQIGVPEEFIRGICREAADFDVRTAMRVGRGLGTSAEFWLNLQSAWDVWNAERGNLKAADDVYGNDHGRSQSKTACVIEGLILANAWGPVSNDPSDKERVHLKEVTAAVNMLMDAMRHKLGEDEDEDDSP